jgi:hypothetical protein
MLRADRPADAEKMFRGALEHYPEHARSLVGLAAALKQQGRDDDAGAALGRAGGAIAALRKGGRGGEARLAESFVLAVQDREDEAVAAVHRVLDEAEMPFTGWTIPIEPLLAPLARVPGFREALKRLADRA